MPKPQLSRIDGQLDRSFPAQIRVLERADSAAGDGAPPAQGNVRLELSFSSDAPYLRTSWFDDPWVEILGHSDGECDLTRLNAGAAVMVNHDRYLQAGSPMAMVGATDRAWIENGKAYVELTMSRRDGLEGLLLDIADGLVRNVSVGYRILERKLIKSYNGKQPDEYRVTRWLPMEVSLVDIPADATVGIGRSAEDRPRYRVVELPESGEQLEKTMPDEQRVAGVPTTPVTPSADNVVAIDQARAAGAQAERERAADIRRLVRQARLSEDFAQRLVEEGVSVDVAGRQILAELARADEAVQTRTANAPRIETVIDETDTRRDAMSAAIVSRANPSIALPDASRRYRGMTLIDMARASIEAAGGRTEGLSRREIAVAALNLDRTHVRAMSTSDFPEILASTVNRTLRQAYMAAPRTFTGWARRSTAPDFRQVARTQLSEMSSMQAVNEGGEYKMLKMGDSAEKYSLGKYGGIIPLTWEALVNDDLSAFDRLPRAIAEEAAATEGDIVYGILSANAALSDTVALFHSTHANLAGSGTAISDTSLGVGRAAMRKQTGPQGRYLNIAPQYLIVGPDKEVEAAKYTSASFVAAKSSDINPNFNTSLEVIVEPRVSGNTWYLSAAPGRIDTVEYAYLEGEDGVYTEQRVGFEVDGLQVKARLAFAAKAIDHRGLYKNPGA